MRHERRWRTAAARATSVALLLLLAAHCRSAAQPVGRLVVGVVDSRCGYALPGVAITATSDSGREASAGSDATGRAVLQLPAGTWRVAATLAGMRSPAATVTTIRGGSESAVRIALDPVPEGSTVISPHGDCHPQR